MVNLLYKSHYIKDFWRTEAIKAKLVS
jgi:hypothetical protein